MKQRIAIFASGSGTNAEALMEYFENHRTIEVAMILSNKPNAFVLQRAEKFSIPRRVFDKETFSNTHEIVHLLQTENISLIVLAGFLWLIPAQFIKVFPNQIINIHPALLPKYAGKGMYGMGVHEAVKKAGETESGITIHYVDEHYDHGQIIYQVGCEIVPEDSPEDIARKVHQLELKYFPQIVEGMLKEQSQL